jgi:hypothetical protein
MRVSSTTSTTRPALASGPFRRLAAALAVAALVAACGGPADDEDVAPGDDTDVEEPDPGDTDDDADGDPDDGDPDDADDGDGGDDGAGAGPQPDPDALADPCAEHEGREMDAFIDVVSPVQDQVVSGSFELVGCSNVFEATIAYELYDGDGVLLDEGFTTAECGTGCVGAFSETVSLDAVPEGEPVVYVQVFSPNVADEGDRQLELVEVLVVLE